MLGKACLILGFATLCHCAAVKKVPLLDGDKDFDKNLGSAFDKGNDVRLFLDYDGTLAQIQKNVNNTYPDENMKKILQTASERCKLYIVTGRNVSDVKERVGLQNITISGSMGHHVVFANGTEYVYPLPSDIDSNLTKLREELKQYEKNGAWVLAKVHTLTYIMGQMAPEMHKEYTTLVLNLVHKYGFNGTLSNENVEIISNVPWGKGDSINYILTQEVGEKWRENKALKPVFMGDTQLDEDAMKVIQGHGLSFRVSKDDTLQTYADYRLGSVKAVGDLLTWINQKRA